MGGFNPMNNNVRTTMNTHQIATENREFVEEENDKLEVGMQHLEEHINSVCN